MAHIRVGTRSSALALAQTNLVVDLLHRAGYMVDIVTMQTRGDQVLDRSLNQIGSKGVFTEELEQALLSDRVDLAVHSLKDLPTELPPGLVVGACTFPSDRRDVLLTDGATLRNMKPGTRLGTSSVRRTAFIRAVRPDVVLVPVRGNLKTRIDKWRSGSFDGLVLAAAGVLRMGWEHLITEYLDPGVITPSPGQGILAVEVAQHRRDLRELMTQMNDVRAQIVAVAERAVLDEVGGGCQIPLGAYAEWRSDTTLSLLAQVAGPDGTPVIKKAVTCSAREAEEAGRIIGRYLREHGALELIQTQEG